MQYQVIRNAKKNIVWGFVNKVIVLLCPFISSTVIRYCLGVDYLGLDGLFTSVISVLSLAELGLSSAVVSHLYKPVAEGNVTLVNSILNFYRKAYRFIGVIMLAVGLCLIPVLPHLIRDSYPDEITLWKVYLVFLFNAVVSYFMYAYMTALIVVYQREDIKSTINSAVTILMTAAKLFLVLVTRNYYLYILMMPVFTIVSNLWTAVFVKKVYPQYSCAGELPAELVGSLKKLVTGTFIQRACALTRNSLDSICVSFYLGLAMTARYNNYFLVSAGVISFVQIVSNAFTGGVGNHVATKSPDENFREFQKLDFIYLWLGGWCTVCLFCLYQPIMKLWMGEDMLLDGVSVGLFCLYFFLLMLGDIRTLYSSAKGLWWEQKWRSLTETVLNCTLNILLGYLMGIRGIILATIISLFLCNCLWSTEIVFKQYLGIEKIFIHFRHQAFYFLVTLGAVALTYIICMQIKTDSAIAQLMVRAVICSLVPNLFYLLVYSRLDIFRDSLRLIKDRTKG